MEYARIMFLPHRQMIDLLVVVSIAWLLSLSAPAALCANTQASVGGQSVKRTPADILDQIPAVKFKKNLPDNFPVPKYPSNVTKTNFIYSTKGLPAASATISTSDTPQKVFDWYQDACKSAGWQITVPTDDTLAKTSKRGKIYMLRGTRPKEQVSLFCMDSKKKPGTIISISWTKTP
jgi:hypothetical protein